MLTANKATTAEAGIQTQREISFLYCGLRFFQRTTGIESDIIIVKLCVSVYTMNDNFFLTEVIKNFNQMTFIQKCVVKKYRGTTTKN